MCAVEDHGNQRIIMRKKPKTALVIFNSVGKHVKEIWGNHHISMVSGELNRRGITNDIFLLLMEVGNARKNRNTIGKFIGLIRDNKYDIVYFETLWMPWIQDRLKSEAPGTAVVCKTNVASEAWSEILPATFVDACSMAGNQWAAGKNNALPNFKYIQLGAGKNLKQRIADMPSFSPCSYMKSLEDNHFFKRLPVRERKTHLGCSYCTVYDSRTTLNSEARKSVFLDMLRYYQEQLPHLDRISLPHPENFFTLLIALAPEITSNAFRPVKFYMQLRPDVIIKRKREIRSMLDAYAGTGSAIHLATVGFENFSVRELKVLNRGYAPGNITSSLNIIKEFAGEFPDSLDMSRAMASFILFNPYTRIPDIELNIEQITKHDFSLFHNININKARINPSTGLYALAQKDNLLREKDENTRMSDLPRGGYQGDYEYRFADPKIGKIYAAFAKAENEVSESFDRHKIYILKRIVDHFK